MKRKGNVVPRVEFIWFERPMAKIAEHGIERDEVEYVVRAAESTAIAQSRTSDHMTVRGLTAAGRDIRVVFDWADDEQTTVVPVTAYEVE